MAALLVLHVVAHRQQRGSFVACIELLCDFAAGGAVRYRRVLLLTASAAIIEAGRLLGSSPAGHCGACMRALTDMRKLSPPMSRRHPRHKYSLSTGN